MKIYPPQELQEAALRKVKDLTLAQSVLIEIIYKARIPIQFIDVKAENGVVYLLGSVNTPERIDECVQAAKKFGCYKSGCRNQSGSGVSWDVSSLTAKKE